MIILIYLLPLLVMLVTYSLVGRRLWGSEIPGEASDHYQNQMQAKRKVSDASIYFFLVFTHNHLPYAMCPHAHSDEDSCHVSKL